MCIFDCWCFFLYFLYQSIRSLFIQIIWKCGSLSLYHSFPPLPPFVYYIRMSESIDSDLCVDCQFSHLLLSSENVVFLCPLIFINRRIFSVLLFVFVFLLFFFCCCWFRGSGLFYVLFGISI